MNLWFDNNCQSKKLKKIKQDDYIESQLNLKIKFCQLVSSPTRYPNQELSIEKRVAFITNIFVAQSKCHFLDLNFLSSNNIFFTIVLLLLTNYKTQNRLIYHLHQVTFLPLKVSI